MAAPADSSGVNTPVACTIRSAPALAPANRFNVAISAFDTPLSTVTTTRPEVASVYQAIPSTPERSTAAPTVPRIAAAYGRGAAAALVGTASTPAVTVATVTASRRTTRPPLLTLTGCLLGRVSRAPARTRRR